MSCGHGGRCCRRSCCKIVRRSRSGSGALLLLILGTLFALTNPTGVAGASQNTNIININSDRDDFDDYDDCDYECDCHSKTCRY
ncbi:hypothetical protein [Clostridium thermarum]|uniref:hypothetical protein n=1 Tax=Clostridium thermarum TaxID=1716543 RepID=UPI00111FB500|nr:hypothetical protein [Clostridium thermarum]